MVKLIIENCEAKLSRWLWLEYKHAAELWGSVIFTNVKDKKMREKLKKIGKTNHDGCEKICIAEETIVLDPTANEELKTSDFEDAEAVVIGGILGYEIPKGRTKELVTSKLKDAKTRNLGKKQMTIDGAVLVAKLISLGAELEEIEITDAVEIKISENESIELLYGYPVAENRVIITPGLVEYLRKC